MSVFTTRRVTGALLGLLLGFVYAGVSQLINRLALPGIPLYQPPLGAFGNILLGALAGAALGLICSWPDSTAWGILIGSAAAAAAFIINMIRMATEGVAIFVVGAFFSLPIMWLAVPVVALLRWTVDKQTEARREGVPWLRRARLPLVLAAAIGLLAAFDLFGAGARSELRQTDALIQAGVRAPDAASLPAPLQTDSAGGFPIGSRARYTLEWTDRDLNRFIDLRPAADFDRHAAVIVRFADGPTVVCLYPTPETQPNCRSY